MSYDPPGRTISLGERRQRVFRLMSDGRWHRTSEISSPLWGGSEGTRRLRELREAFVIEKRKYGNTDEYEYRMLLVSPGQPMPQPSEPRQGALFDG